MAISIRVSYDTFRELREDGAYYIDKTEVIEEYLINNFEKAMLFTRPRRFGKTITMTMIRDFLDISQDSREIFKGLKIMDCEKAVTEYMNQYPVVFITLKDIFGTDFDSILQSLRIAISKLCEDNRFLLENEESIDEVNKELFNTLWRRKADQADTEQGLELICQLLSRHYGKKVYVIIDEYDVPMAKALGTPYYDRVRDMIEHTLSYVCKTNPHVKAVLMTGCLYTVKNSTYTGVNNIVPYTVLSNNFATAIGFTDENVRKLLEDANIPDYYAMVEEWYNGYIFGRDKMYCPWDVLRFVRSVLDGSYSAGMGPESYWVNTSETSQNLIHGFLGKTEDANESFEQLLAGNTIECTVNDSLPYHKIHDNGDNLWSALLETGYLTKATPEHAKSLPLRIPNKEILVVFRQEVWDYFKDKISNIFVKDLISALWKGDEDKAKTALSQILEATLSFYHEYHEYSYHLILDGFFTGLGYLVQSERETGYGRSDLIIQDPLRSRCLILELKHVQNDDEMENALKEATAQIIEKKYESQLIYEGYTERLEYAMAFSGKKVLISKR